jgi:hypothetical protein
MLVFDTDTFPSLVTTKSPPHACLLPYDAHGVYLRPKDRNRPQPKPTCSAHSVTAVSRDNDSILVAATCFPTNGRCSSKPRSIHLPKFNSEPNSSISHATSKSSQCLGILSRHGIGVVCPVVKSL